MRIVAGKTDGVNYDVTLNGKKVDKVMEVWTLGIPTEKPRLGFVNACVVDCHGQIFIDPSGERVASSWRFGRVKLDRVAGSSSEPVAREHQQSNQGE